MTCMYTAWATNLLPLLQKSQNSSKEWKQELGGIDIGPKAEVASLLATQHLKRLPIYRSGGESPLIWPAIIPSIHLTFSNPTDILY